MKMKRSVAILLALVSLMAMLVIPAAASAAPDYKYTLPDNYSDSKDYPVVYLLPSDGRASHNETLYNAIRSFGTDVIIIRPTFTSGMDLHAEMADLVKVVDSKYNTIADKNYRAIVGAQAGGYLAYALGMTNGTAYKNPADLFTFIASVNGDFAYDNYAYGNILSIIQDGLKAYEEQKKALDKQWGDYAQYFYPPNPLESYYTYMDTPVDSEYANVAGSTNDLGSFYIGQGVGSNLHEFTARPGTFSTDFIKESGKRIMANFTNWMLSDVATGEIALSEPTLTASDKNATANYTVTLSKEIATFTTASVPMKITVSVVDPKTGDVLTSASTTKTVNGAGDYSGSLTFANKVNGSFSNVNLSVELLEATLDLSTAYLVRSSKPVVDGDYQKIDLMGDWYFNYIGTATPLNVSAITESKEYRSWSIAQPGLGNWADGYGNINSETVGTPSTSPYFGYMIIGGGYYAKEFDLPAGFDAQDVVLSIGYIDDRCEVFLNGKRVGATGMDANGNPTGDTTWAVYSNFEIDPSLLNYGGTNTVVVRAWNDTSLGAGGWYSGPIGLYSKAAFDAENGQSDSKRFYEETYYSNALKKNMEYLIYLPEGYEDSDRYYPTMYLLHQFNSDHTSYRTDKIDQLMDELIASGRIDDMIVVIPNSAEVSFWRDSYEKMVTNDLIPHIDENYRTVNDARYRMTAGCSMGGQGAMAVALRNPNYFSGAVSFFGAFSYGYDTDPRLIAATESAEYLDNFALYFICGNQDSYGFGSCNIDLHKQLLSKGANHYFFIENGEHNSAFYVPYFKDAIEYAYNDMKHVDGSVRRLVAGEIEAQLDEGKVILTPSFGVADDFASCFNIIPASSYTKDQTPEVNVPLIITVRQGGVDHEIVLRDHNVTPMKSKAPAVDMKTLDAIDITDIVDPSQPFKVTYEAVLFEHDPVTLKSMMVDALAADPSALPDTGDHSSMMFWALALAASAVLLLMISKKRCDA